MLHADVEARDSSGAALKTFWIVVTVALAVIVSWGVLVWSTATDLTWGTFGDAFAPIAGGLSALAVASAFAAMVLQTNELKAQRHGIALQTRELRLQVAELKEQRDAMLQQSSELALQRSVMTAQQETALMRARLEASRNLGEANERLCEARRALNAYLQAHDHRLKELFRDGGHADFLVDDLAREGRGEAWGDVCRDDSIVHDTVWGVLEPLPSEKPFDDEQTLAFALGLVDVKLPEALETACDDFLEWTELFEEAEKLHNDITARYDATFGATDTPESSDGAETATA
ncbi:MAG: hypothetical protein R3B40_31810 [Polyangiales bacterium]